MVTVGTVVGAGVGVATVSGTGLSTGVGVDSGTAGGGTGATDAGFVVGVLAPPPINLIVGAVVSFTRTVLDTGSA